MKRPFLLRHLPDRLQASLFARHYRGRHGAWNGLYDAAPLTLAPGIGMRLVPGDIISDYIAFTGVYELDLSRHVAALADRGGTMIDVGANLGYFSLLWASRRSSNRVVAFEASPRNVELLRQNVAQNGLADQIQIVAKAAGRQAGRLSFDVGPADQTGWGGLAAAATDRTINVDVVRVDDVAPFEPIALLKVDTEGADAWALMGCERLFRAGLIDEVWFEEFKPRAEALGIAPGAGPAFLRSVGYLATPTGDPNGEMVEWSARRG
jgi:FkbM family methyltransferase